MSVTLHSRSNVLHATVYGDLTLTTLDHALPAFADIIRGEEPVVSLDLTSAPTVDMTAVGAVISLRQTLRETGRSLSVHCPPGAFRGLVAMLGLEDDLPFSDTLPASPPASEAP